RALLFRRRRESPARSAEHPATLARCPRFARGSSRAPRRPLASPDEELDDDRRWQTRYLRTASGPDARWPRRRPCAPAECRRAALSGGRDPSLRFSENEAGWQRTPAERPP